MTDIIKGTTPTFIKTFSTVNVEDITVAFLNIKGKVDIEKNLSQATVGQDYIAWTLTQEETLSLGSQIGAMVNWKTNDGTRGATLPKTYILYENYKDEVI